MNEKDGMVKNRVLPHTLLQYTKRKSVYSKVDNCDTNYASMGQRISISSEISRAAGDDAVSEEALCDLNQLIEENADITQAILSFCSDVDLYRIRAANRDMQAAVEPLLLRRAYERLPTVIRKQDEPSVVETCYEGGILKTPTSSEDETQRRSFVSQVRLHVGRSISSKQAMMDICLEEYDKAHDTLHEVMVDEDNELRFTRDQVVEKLQEKEGLFRIYNPMQWWELEVSCVFMPRITQTKDIIQQLWNSTESYGGCFFSKSQCSMLRRTLLTLIVCRENRCKGRKKSFQKIPKVQLGIARWEYHREFDIVGTQSIAFTITLPDGTHVEMLRYVDLAEFEANDDDSSTEF